MASVPTAPFDPVVETQKLKSLLDPLILCFERLRTLLESERQALNARDLPGLESASRRIEELLNEIKGLDLSRQNHCLRMGKTLGLSRDALNLQELDVALGGGTGLLEYRQRLRDRIEAAEHANRENQAMFKGVLIATEALLRVLKEGTQGPAASYNRRGYRQSGPGHHFLSKQF